MCIVYLWLVLIFFELVYGMACLTSKSFCRFFPIKGFLRGLQQRKQLLCLFFFHLSIWIVYVRLSV